MHPHHFADKHKHYMNQSNNFCVIFVIGVIHCMNSKLALIFQCQIMHNSNCLLIFLEWVLQMHQQKFSVYNKLLKIA